MSRGSLAVLLVATFFSTECGANSRRSAGTNRFPAVLPPISRFIRFALFAFAKHTDRHLSGKMCIHPENFTLNLSSRSHYPANITLILPLGRLFIRKISHSPAIKEPFIRKMFISSCPYRTIYPENVLLFCQYEAIYLPNFTFILVLKSNK